MDVRDVSRIVKNKGKDGNRVNIELKIYEYPDSSWNKKFRDKRSYEITIPYQTIMNIWRKIVRKGRKSLDILFLEDVIVSFLVHYVENIITEKEYWLKFSDKDCEECTYKRNEMSS
jgi:hypothetical protein